MVLLTSSVLVVFAVRALRSEQSRHLAHRLTVAGAGVGACFVVIKVLEYHEKVAAGITPSANEFFMYYFVLTGLHLAHVIVGLGVLLALSRLARNPRRPPRTSRSSRAVAASGTWSTSVFKIRLVGLYFMELREAPLALRGVFEGYCVVLLGLLTGMYLLA